MAKLLVQNYAKIPNEYVAIERSRGLSVLEEKMVYLLINAMQKRFEHTKKSGNIDYEYVASGQLTCQEFSNIMQTTNNLKQIKEGVQDLHTLSFAITFGHEIRFIHLFKEFRVNTEIKEIRYFFDDNFMHFFTGICKNYFSLEIQEVIGLNSSHSIQIYQTLKSKLNMDKKEHEYTITELKKMLNIEKKYQMYNNLKQKVLEVARNQINNSQASKFTIDYEEIKTGKSVTSIRFIIQPRGKNYYVETNKIAKYKIEQVSKLITKWYRHPDSIVRLLSDKIAIELKHKNPNRVLITNYIDTIETFLTQK